MTKTPKRPRDANQLAKFMIDAASGEVESPKQKASAVKGGLTRAIKLTPKQRSEIARVAADARWKKSGD
jgi:hypothetical protein